jgi:hypothetical protein
LLTVSRQQLFISPLRLAQPPVIRSLKDLEDLISTLFGNILELRAANTSLLEFFTERQREQGGIISTIGDVYLTAAAEFRNLYPDYIGRLPRAEERLREELANNSNFRFFVDVSLSVELKARPILTSKFFVLSESSGRTRTDEWTSNT